MTSFLIIGTMILSALYGFGAALWTGDWRFLLACLPFAVFLKVTQ